MSDQKEKMDQLLAHLYTLLRKQEAFSDDISKIKTEITKLQASIQKESKGSTEVIQEPIVQKPIKQPIPKAPTPEPPPKKLHIPKTHFPKQKSGFSKDLEKFIGENLINKVGIIITVIGVSIGAKYAIDNELISPLMRILLGYLVGLGLLGFGLKLKKNYKNFSAVLISGAMAILYFITYAAYTFYGLFPVGVTFALMVLITAGTVFAAVSYNRQVIAHIGMVGAYAIPFLLSEDPGNIKILLGYVAIINVGILYVAFKKYWKLLFYAGFVLTWIIFCMWYIPATNSVETSTIALTYASIFYLLFYAIFLAYKLIEKEVFKIEDVLLVLLNSMLFFAIGHSALNNVETLQSFTGLFTLGNAAIHFAVSLIIYRQKLADRKLQLLITSMIWLFITICIPVQFTGKWVTIFWVVQGAVLYWIGRSKDSTLYEYLSYPVMLIAFFSLLKNWGEVSLAINNFDGLGDLRELLNTLAIAAIVFIAAFTWINWVKFKADQVQKAKNTAAHQLINLFIPGVLLLAIYNSIRIEIIAYWAEVYAEANTGNQDTLTVFHTSKNILKFRMLWLINFSALFLAILSLFNFTTIKNRVFGLLNLSANMFFIIIFLGIGLYELSELRESHLSNSTASIFFSYSFLMRYISIIFIVMLLNATKKYVIRDYIKLNFDVPFELFLTVVICWLASSELLHWMDISDASNSYKLGLSIFWGLFSLSVVALGIWKNKKHLRVFAIALFGITLVKLFFYDIAHLNTISKTIVFVSLGILLLIISFLYNKYTKKIFEE